MEGFSHSAITARKLYTYTSTALSTARHSFMPLSELGRRGDNENSQSSKLKQRGFKAGLPRLIDWRSTSVDRLAFYFG